jgi:hypothetical protein
MKQRVEIINCKNCNVRVLGRCTALDISQSSQTTILTDDCLQAEVADCTKVELQVQGDASRVIIDRSSEVAIMLPCNQAQTGPKAADFELISSRCDAVKIVLLRPEGKHTVKAVPTTYITKFSGQEDDMITVPTHR